MVTLRVKHAVGTKLMLVELTNEQVEKKIECKDLNVFKQVNIYQRRCPQKCF